MIEWWRSVEIQFNGFLGEGKKITNTRRRVENLVQKRKDFLALLGTGREDDKSILNEILDRWIAFLDIYDTDIQAKKKSKEEHE